jgi:hypothetical protein
VETHLERMVISGILSADYDLHHIL